MFLLREASPADLRGLLELAKLLNTLNLPPDEAYLRELIDVSEASFSGGDEPESFDPARRFLFVLEAPDGRVVGTSALHAQHGTPDEPHVFFRVQEDERLSHLDLERTDDPVYKKHVVLTLGETFNGPSEVGGLVLHPDLSGQPGKLGTLLSLSRFMFVAIHRNWFRDQMLAELLPPLEKNSDGSPRSLLWDALGRRLTGLDYDSADKLSRTNHHFIHRLFPRTPIYACLLPQEAQAVIGKVGPASQGAARLLERVGFEISDRVDPFDGGPHYHAVTDELLPYSEGGWARTECVDRISATPRLVAYRGVSPRHFVCARIPVEFKASEGELPVVMLEREAADRLSLTANAQVWVWPGRDEA